MLVDLTDLRESPVAVAVAASRCARERQRRTNQGKSKPDVALRT